MALTTDRPGGLSAEAFERLLQGLGDDREGAAAEYERLRRRLIYFFRLRHAPSPEALADETFDRVARKLQEGITLGNPRAYLHGVAKWVLLEGVRHRAREHAAVAELRPRRAWRDAETPSDVAEARLACLERCLLELTASDRELIVGYYQGEGVVHLEGRRLLAERQGMTYGALKTRAHRIRTRLEECLCACLGRRQGRNR